MKHKHLILAIVALFLLPHAGHAASSQWASSGDTRMRLVVAEPLRGDTIIRAALQVELAAGWKTYWRDPGEAGVPLQLDLTGSQNIILKDVLFPAPKRFDDGVTVWAGYDRPVMFPIELERGDGTIGSKLMANIFIGICETICVPFQTNLTVTIENAVASSADHMIVQAAFSALPTAPRDEFKVLSMTMHDKTVQIEAQIESSLIDAQLYLAPSGGWQFGAPRLVSKEEGKARFEADVIFSPKEGLLTPIEVQYTMIGADKAVSGLSLIAK